MKANAVPVLPSRDLVRTASFYRYFGFEAVEQGVQNDGEEVEPTFLRLRRGELELCFTFSEFDRTSSEYMFFHGICIMQVDDIHEWYKVFKNTRMNWKALHPSLTRISDAAWGMPAFAVTDHDGNIIWFVQEVGEAAAEQGQ